jgi:hypothetical protein
MLSYAFKAKIKKKHIEKHIEKEDDDGQLKFRDR